MGLPDLFHYTCEHSQPGIIATGTLTPHPSPFGGPPLVWLTDLKTPNRDALGLTSEWITCDRTRHTFLAHPSPHIQPWMDYRKTLTQATWWIDALESLHTRPRHWFISLQPVPVAYLPSGGSW